jgi:hypothetical protein
MGGLIETRKEGDSRGIPQGDLTRLKKGDTNLEIAMSLPGVARGD